MASALARVFIMYLIIPSALAISALVLKSSQLAVSISFLLTPFLWGLLLSEKKTEKGRSWEAFIAIFLLSSASTLFISFRSSLEQMNRIPVDFFDAGFLIAGFALVSGYADREKIEMTSTARSGAALILFSWTNLCGAPIVRYSVEFKGRPPTEVPNWSILIHQAATWFTIGVVFILVGFILPAAKKNI